MMLISRSAASLRLENFVIDVTRNGEDRRVPGSRKYSASVLDLGRFED